MGVTPAAGTEEGRMHTAMSREAMRVVQPRASVQSRKVLPVKLSSFACTAGRSSPQVPGFVHIVGRNRETSEVCLLEE